MSDDKLDAFDAYQIYLALKLHFAPGSYDAVKYNYKVRADREKFRHKPEARWFHNLSKKYDRPSLVNALVSNFVSGKKYGGMFEGAEFEETHTQWRRINEALSHYFETDLKEVWNTACDDGQMAPRLLDALGCENGKYPLVIKLYLQKRINLETVVILDRLTNFMSKSDQKISDPIQWPKLRHLIDRYEKLMPPIDKEDYKNTLRTIFY
jgi:hypothetical protein